jgi:hypothetical protein
MQQELLKDPEETIEEWISIHTFIKYTNDQILAILFPEVVREWRLNTLGKSGCAMPTGLPKSRHCCPFAGLLH